MVKGYNWWQSVGELQKLHNLYLSVQSLNMADEEEVYGADEHTRFEAEEYDQDYVDGGAREDVSNNLNVSFHTVQTQY
jgi:hypothetical protein